MVDVDRFEGYPAGAHATAVPNAFFTEVLPSIEDPAELAVTAYVFFAAGRVRRYPRHVRLSELAHEEPLLASLTRLGGGGGGWGRAQSLREGVTLPAQLETAVNAAVARGTLLEVHVEQNGVEDRVLLVNTPSGRRDAARIKAGLIDLGTAVEAPAPRVGPPPTIYRLYEDTFGALTPAVAQELEATAAEYPPEWIARAFRHAAIYRARNWNYVRAILERWQEQGRSDEETDRDDTGVDEGERFFRGRYGQYV